jgi:hypothetical protein
MFSDQLLGKDEEFFCVKDHGQKLLSQIKKKDLKKQL